MKACKHGHKVRVTPEGRLESCAWCLFERVIADLKGFVGVEHRK